MRNVLTEISHSTMTIGNGTLVDRNCFDDRDLENHLLQSFPQLMNHPVFVHACMCVERRTATIELYGALDQFHPY
jgi:hypothetical protein